MELNRDILRQLPLALRIEIEENAQRKPLTQSELAYEQRRILEVLRQHAKPGERTDLTSEKTFSQVAPRENRATALIGHLFNESHKQVEKRLTIVAAAAAEPERFGKLLADMDCTGCVNGPYRRLKNARAAEAIRAEPPPLPGRGPYHVGQIDIPWAYEPDDEDARERGVLPYPTLSIAQASALDVGSIMHEDSILWMWVTNFILARGLHLSVLDAWGFEPKTVVTWPKDRVGRGHWVKGQSEHLVMAVRGKPVVTLTVSSGAQGCSQREADRGVRLHRIALPGTAVRRYVLALSARRTLGLPWQRSADRCLALRGRAMSRRRPNQMEGPFLAWLIEMILSPAFRALSFSGLCFGLRLRWPATAAPRPTARAWSSPTSNSDNGASAKTRSRPRSAKFAPWASSPLSSRAEAVTGSIASRVHTG
jgi:MT-A70